MDAVAEGPDLRRQPLPASAGALLAMALGVVGCVAGRPRPAPIEELQVSAQKSIVSGDADLAGVLQACFLCHGPAGGGDVRLGTPSIAGQPAWYLLAQLRNFRSGRRGEHPDDGPGRQMAAIARALPAALLDGVVAALQRLPPVPTVRTLAGDAANGRLVYGEQCIECHRFNGQGEKAFGSSPLTTFQDWYLAREFEEFHRGWRGQDPADIHGTKMRDVARYLDAKSRRDVIVYIAELAARHPPGR